MLDIWERSLAYLRSIGSSENINTSISSLFFNTVFNFLNSKKRLSKIHLFTSLDLSYEKCIISSDISIYTLIFSSLFILLFISDSKISLG